MQIRDFFVLAFLLMSSLMSYGQEKNDVSEVVDRLDPSDRERKIHQWENGAMLAAQDLGCKNVIWQLHGEPLQQAISVYAHNYVAGNCLILAPTRGGENYYLGYAGQFDGYPTNDRITEWPGVPVYYLSDDLHPIFVKNRPRFVRSLRPEVESGIRGVREQLQ
jgi:hypothetical protein